MLGSALRAVREGAAQKNSGVAVLLLNTGVLSNSYVKSGGKCLSGKKLWKAEWE